MSIFIIVGKKANLKLEYMEEAISLVKDIVNKRLNKYLKQGQY